MSLILELTPEQERELRAHAARSGVPVSEYVVRRLLGHSPEEQPPAMSGKEFVKRARGLIPPEELDRMEKAIEEGCEQIEPDEW